MNTMNQMIEMYLADKQLAWAPTTLKSESHRLHAAAPMLNGNPLKLWQSLEHHGPYGRATIWTRVSDFWQWCLDNNHISGGNPYRAFKQKNARLFKNVYERKTPEISFEEARARIATIQDNDVRNLAEQLLASGMRVSEPKTRDANGNVVGKGSKSRRVYGCNASDGYNVVNYQKLRRALAAVGLKPHDLRKIFLTRLVELGANEFELCKVAGWESISTASSYIKANDERIKELVEQVQGGLNDSITEKQVS
jgi:site-specific recombinase XerD